MKQMMEQRLRMKTWTKKLTAVWLAALIGVFSFNYDPTVQAGEAAAPQLKSFLIFDQFEIIVKPEGIIGNLNGLKLNQNELKEVTSKNDITQGKYYLDITGNTIYMPKLATGDMLSLVMKDGKEYSYSFAKNEGSMGTFTLQTSKPNPVTPKPQPGTPDDPGSSDPGTSEHGITDANAPKLTNSEASWGRVALQLEPKDTAAKIIDVFSTV